jgi:hypothetical protein
MRYRSVDNVEYKYKAPSTLIDHPVGTGLLLGKIYATKLQQ